MNRLSDSELEALLNDVESHRVERKELFNTTGIRARVCQAICAFANDLPNSKKPGILFLGVKDDGSNAGLDIDEQLLNTLAAIRSDGKILPLPSLAVEKRVLNGSPVAVVTVMPSDAPPVKYNGCIWVRVGASRAKASAQEERVLTEKRKHKDMPYDMQPLPRATISDLSKTLFENEYLPAAVAPDVLADNQRSYEQYLSTCKMVASPEDTTPTVLGMLTVGKNPQDFIPGAHIQFLRIDGTKLSDNVVDQEMLAGTIAESLRRASEKLEAHNRMSVDIVSAAQHKMQAPYPSAAIRQILYNAVQHRTYQNTNAPVRFDWYNDRIEILSPGGPYGNVTSENFGEPGITDYRNPNIGSVLKNLGFVQSFGRGIITARNELKKNGNPDIEFDVNESIILCKIMAQR